MYVIKIAFITGCFGVNIIFFYIENKQSCSYLKNMRSFCATRYKKPLFFFTSIEIETYDEIFSSSACYQLTRHLAEQCCI